MRLSRFYAPTLKETPADAEVVSHQLMLRAGMIRLLSRGTYDFLPLGLRVVRKIESIVREELDRAGANEVLMPIVQPAELWRETGRWDGYIQEGLLANFKDRTGRELCLAPTAEEVVTDLVRKDVQSFRELPLNLYQINWKFRDEIRPRFGLMRGREFLMMDAYSFDRDVKSAHVAYWKMYEAYKKAFTRCGLEFRPVEAATGQIGGNMSHEFQVLAETGEDAIAACDKCEYAANLELAAIAKGPKVEIDPASLAKLEKVATPGKKTIADVCAFLQMPEEKSIKTLVYETDKGLVMALLRGDHELAPEKLKKAAQAKWVKPAAEGDVEAKIGPVGFLGPVGAKTKGARGAGAPPAGSPTGAGTATEGGSIDVLADRGIEFATNLVMGANETDTHYKNANPGRDFTPTKYADLRVAKAGDRCPKCTFDDKETGAKAKGGVFEIKRGIEVGHVFYLGTKYSSAMKAEFKEESGKLKPFEMGCYGIGITRVAAAAVEQNHDKDGILWPTPIAPFQVLVLSASPEKKDVAEAADKIHDSLEAKGIEVLYDDRAERAGFKFKDADLIGIPYRIVVGEKNLAEGSVEVKVRRGGAVEKMAPEAAVEWAVSKVKADLARRGDRGGAAGGTGESASPSWGGPGGAPPKQ